MVIVDLFLEVRSVRQSQVQLSRVSKVNYYCAVAKRDEIVLLAVEVGEAGEAGEATELVVDSYAYFLQPDPTRCPLRISQFKSGCTFRGLPPVAMTLPTSTIQGEYLSIIVCEALCGPAFM